jgi:hypothetical protein
VKKQFKADIPLAERSAWEDWITRDRAEIARLSAEITKAEAPQHRLGSVRPDPRRNRAAGKRGMTGQRWL